MSNVVALATAARQPDFISPLRDLMAQIRPSKRLAASLLVVCVLVFLCFVGICPNPFNRVLLASEWVLVASTC